MRCGSGNMAVYANGTVTCCDAYRSGWSYIFKELRSVKVNFMTKSY